MKISRSIILSLVGHLTVFGIFNISFGARLPKLDCAGINFRGAILSNFDLIDGCASLRGLRAQRSRTKQSLRRDCFPLASLGVAMTGSDTYAKLYNWRERPAVAMSFNEDKMSFSQEASLPFQVKNKPAVMFYPRLPGYFNIYFKDRQVVHIELMFNIVSGDSTNSIVIKRKVSSGNLEADLLSLRYIGHYLFIQQARFIPDTWQTVKIDLSTKND